MIKCLIADDEFLSLNLLNSYVDQIPNLQLIKRCNNAIELLDVINNNSIDLIFMDIQMPQLTGIDFVKSLKGQQPLIIFTTAYPNYALEGFELGVVDYLVKPFSFERFVQAVNKAADRLKNTSNTTIKAKDYIFVKADHKHLKINFDDILFIEGLKEYVSFYTKDKKRIITLEALKNLEDMLPKEKFIRVHKSYIVSINEIISINGNTIEIKEKEIPLGGVYKENIEKIILNK